MTLAVITGALLAEVGDVEEGKKRDNQLGRSQCLYSCLIVRRPGPFEQGKWLVNSENQTGSKLR